MISHLANATLKQREPQTDRRTFTTSTSQTLRRRGGAPQGKVIVPPRVERSAVDLQDLLGFAAAARQIVPSVLCVVVATVISLDGLFWFRCLPRAVYLLGLHPAYDEIVRARNEDFRNA